MIWNPLSRVPICMYISLSHTHTHNVYMHIYIPIYKHISDGNSDYSLVTLAKMPSSQNCILATLEGIALKWMHWEERCPSSCQHPTHILGTPPTLNLPHLIEIISYVSVCLMRLGISRARIMSFICIFATWHHNCSKVKANISWPKAPF